MKIEDFLNSVRNVIKNLITLRDVFFIMVGILISIIMINQIYVKHFDDMILMKKFVYKKKVYNVTEEIIK